MIFILLPSISFADYEKLYDVNLSNSNSNTARVRLSLTHLNKYHVITLKHPDRLVVDLSDVILMTNLAEVDFSHSMFNSVRAGHPVLSTLRLVFSLKSPVKFHAYGKSDNLTIDVTEIKTPVNSHFSFAKLFGFNSSASAKSDKVTQVTSKSVEPKVSHENISKPIEAKPKIATAIKKTVKITETPKKHTFIVVIDPGHGGKDPGAEGKDGAKEKTVVLAIARQLATLINHQPHMHAVLTRKGDYFVTLRNRLRLAHKGKADIFIAIHADSYLSDQSTAGASVYALSQRGATSEAARWLAQRENYSELGGVDLADLGDKSAVLRSVLIDLAQTATITDSLRLGKSMLDSLGDVTELHYKRVEQAPFVVLKSPDIPSVLVETGFISNPSEEARLKNKEYQDKLALALFHGIQVYIKKYSVANI